MSSARFVLRSHMAGHEVPVSNIRHREMTKADLAVLVIEDAAMQYAGRPYL